MSVRIACMLGVALTLRVAVAAGPVPGEGAGVRSGLPDGVVLHYVTRCLGQTLPHPVEFYARGGWYATDNLRREMRERQGDIESTAMVWKLHDLPRAVYQWNHDDEFDRDIVACLTPDGAVTRAQSRYTPGDSEPGQRWVYVHTMIAGRGGAFASASHYTERDGRPRNRPQLTAEDQDFIAGERVYRTWNDFDYAGLVGAQGR